MEKQYMYVLAIVGVVAIVGLIVLISGNFVNVNDREISGEAIRMANPTSPAQINANACNADAICEINLAHAEHLKVENVAETNTLWNREWITIGDFNNPSIYMSPDMVNINVETHIGEPLISDSYIDTEVLLTNTFRIGTVDNPLVVAMGDKFTIRKQVQFGDLRGDGNAYACLDSTGNLFRSEVPCN